VLKVLLLLAVVALVLAGPFAAIRQPWAVRIWKKLRLFLFAYVLVIVLVAALRLIFGWDELYG
jgi:hypothetical protein